MKKIKNYLTFLREAQETSEAPVPGEEVVADESRGGGVIVEFGAGKHQLDTTTRNFVVDAIKNNIQRWQNWREIMRLYSENRGSKKRPMQPLFTIHVGTSWEGTDEINADLARQRRTYMEKIVIDAVKEACEWDIVTPPADLIQQLITPQSSYKRSGVVDTYGGNYDPKKTQKDSWNRIGMIEVNRAVVKGLTPDEISKIGAEMRSGENMIPDDLNKIVNQLCQCETYSDLQDLNKNLQDKGGLEEFLNSTVGFSAYPLLNTRKTERQKAIECINKAADKQIASEFQNKIVIRPKL
jgi:hypothetical protein